MKTTIYERIYKRLERLGILALGEAATRAKSGAFMDLSYDCLHKNADHTYIIALAHNYIQNGDVMPDPDMEIRIHPRLKMAEALTMQDYFGYRQVYHGDKVDLRAKRELNKFLAYWLNNIRKQGFSFKKGTN